MVTPYERPLDLLNECKKKNVLVTLKNEKVFSATLLAFDIHINLVLDNCKELDDAGKIKTNFGLKFIKGDVVESVSPGN